MMPDKRAGSANIQWWPENFEPVQYVEREEKGPGKKITWLELFHDLVYAVAVGKLTHGLLESTGPEHFLLFLLLFVLVLWSWMNDAYYCDLHGNESIWVRCATFLGMLVAAWVAVTLPHVFQGEHRAFAIAFSCMQGLIMILWLSTGWFDPKHKHVSRRHGGIYALALGLFVWSIFAPWSCALQLWTAGLLLNFGVELFVYKSFEERLGAVVFKPSARIVERFGQFTIIVLGESFVGIVGGVVDPHHLNALHIASFVLCVAITFLLWWLYFEVLGSRKTRKGFMNYLLLNLLHLPLFIAFALLGPTMQLVLGSMDAQNMDVRWELAIAIAVVLATIVALSTILAKDQRSRTDRLPEGSKMFGAAVVIALTPLWLSSASVVWLLSAIAFLLLILVVQGTASGGYPKLLPDANGNDGSN